jgi:hypothetical protein
MAAFSSLRLLIASVIGAVLFCAPFAQAFNLEQHIDFVRPRFIPEGQFKRISEYFTGVENTGGKTILRTQDDQRAGMYFILSLDWLKNRHILLGSQIRIDYVRSDNVEPQQVLFLLPDSKSTFKEVYLGITGKDWASPDVTLAAWKVTVLDPLGREVAAEQSFLWDLPEEKK